MLKVFVPSPLPGVRQLPLLSEPDPSDNRLFQSIPHAAFDGCIEVVQDVAAADAVLLPHTHSDASTVPGYLEGVLETARAAGKKTLVFSVQDDPTPLSISDAIIFRPSVYRSTKLPNEIVMPAQVEDLGALHGVALLSKGNAPTVGFVGKAGFDRLRDALRYYVRNYLLRSGSHREGTYFRRHALASCARYSGVVLKAITRKRFSAHARTIELSPEQARQEYVQNMRESLFTLAPRGDGNYSLRFYETLSLARIPVLIDTDMMLPLEDQITYDDFILRIPGSKVDATAERVHAFWESADEATLQHMQARAREVFEKFLYMPAFLRIVLTPEYLAPFLSL